MSQTASRQFDKSRAKAFTQQLMGDMAGSVAMHLCVIGDRLGLFEDLAQSGGGFDTLILFWLGEPLIHPHFGRIWRAAMRAAVQQVVSGVWVGHGADAFVEEVSNIMLPGVGKIGEQISLTQNNINHAIDTIDRADEEATNRVNGLADQYANIYH